MKILIYCAFGLGVALPGTSYSIEVTDNLEIGLVVKVRADYDSDRDIKEIGVDTLAPYIRYTSDTWIASAKYRFYGKYYPYKYTDKFGDISFLEYAWVGYKFSNASQLQLGVNQVPFGLLPYFSNTITETLGYTVGLEDVYQLGVKYQIQVSGWDFQGGYYLRPTWQGKGTSVGGVTYSNVPTRADLGVENGANNSESDLLAVRAARTVVMGGWTTEIGASVLSSSLTNNDTHQNGRRNAAAIHLSSSKGPWSTGFLFARQQMSPQNPGNRNVVTFGGYDGSFNVASRGNLLTADLNYHIGGSYLDSWLSNIRLYGNYSTFIKSENGFKNSQRYIAGVSFSSWKNVSIGAEWLWGKNDPYVGLNSYTQSLAAGGTNRWAKQAKISLGYSF